MMYVCDEGFGKIPWCPCLLDNNEVAFCRLTMEPKRDSCPFAPILKALPDASEEQIEAMTEMLKLCPLEVRAFLHFCGKGDGGDAELNGQVARMSMVRWAAGRTEESE